MGTYTKLLQAEKAEAKPKETAKPVAAKSPTAAQTERTVAKTEHKKAVVSRNHDTTTPRYHDTTVSRYHDTIIEAIRKAVKQIGKEAATHRFTVAEKQAIANIVFTYKNRGVITSENEISRVAVNFILEDFEQNGEGSVLAKALKALNE